MLPARRRGAAPLALVALWGLWHCCDAVYFYLAPGARRCFTEDLPSNSQILGEAGIVSGLGIMEDIDVWVTTLQGQVLFHRRDNTHGKFTFRTPPVPLTEHSGIDDEADEINGLDAGYDEDTYRICVEHQVGAEGSAWTTHQNVRRMVSLRVHHSTVTGISSLSESVSGTSTAQSANANALEDSMRDMHTTLDSMAGDLAHLQEKERRLAKTVEETNRRVARVAGVSVALAGVTAAAQLRYFRMYFKRKKLC